MNIGEKISMYKDKLGFKYYQELADAAGVSGGWLTELCKKEDFKKVDVSRLYTLCKYLGISIEEFLVDAENKYSNIEIFDSKFINEECDDIGSLINEAIVLLDKKEIKMDGLLLNDKSKQICKDALDVVKTMTKQYL